MRARIAVLPGDGIGPEVTRAALRVLEMVSDVTGHEFEVREGLIGAAAIDATGDPLPRETLDLCKGSEAVLLGAVGDPRYGVDSQVRPEQALLRLRSDFDLFANLRPVPVLPALIDRTPFKPEILASVDLLFVRELTGGLYFGPRREQDGDVAAFDTLRYEDWEIDRVCEVAFRLAGERRGLVTSVDKANVLASMRQWRRGVEKAAQRFPDVELEHRLVDAFAMDLLRSPSSFDVVVTTNLFGDILSDEAAALSGSLGILPSASVGSSSFGLYEPVHGSAPDIAGLGVANPIGAILSVALMLRHSFGLEEEAQAIESAVNAALECDLLTPDLCPSGREPAKTGTFARAAARFFENAWSEAEVPMLVV